MSVRVHCPNCRNQFAVFDRLLGRSIRCPQCRQEMQLPSADEIHLRRELDKLNANMAQMLTEYSAQPIASLAVEQPVGNYRFVKLGRFLKRPPRARRQKKAAHKLEWDITPMVDVAFLLLIFFMLTASFSIQKVIRTAPQRNEQPGTSSVQQVSNDDSDSVTVQVDEQNSFSVVMPDGRTIVAPSKQDLIVLLADARRQLGIGETPKMIVLAHEDSMHGTVVAALDAGREADFNRFEMVAVESFD